MLLQKLRNGFRRVAAGKPCVAAGADVLLRRSPRVVLPQISGDSSPTDFGGWLAILGWTSRARAAGIDALLRRSPPRVVLPPIYGDSDSTVASYTVHYR